MFWSGFGVVEVVGDLGEWLWDSIWREFLNLG